MPKLRQHQLEILINLVDQSISNYESVLERTGKKDWRLKINELSDTREELYNMLILEWYDKGFNGHSSEGLDDKVLIKAYNVGKADAAEDKRLKQVMLRTLDDIIRRVISNE